MKIFFSLLLLANIAFGLVQWLLPYEQLIPDNKKIPVAEQLRLLDEPLESEMIAEAEVSEAVQEDEVMVAEETIDDRLCYTIGPFKDKTRALEVSARYTANDVKTELKSNQEKEYLGIMVYTSDHENKQ
jgi:predicted amino acid racemase